MTGPVSFEAAEALAEQIHRGVVKLAAIDPWSSAYRDAIRLEFVLARLNPGWVHYAQHGQVWSERVSEATA